MLHLETYPFDKFEELLDTFLEACHCGGVLHSAHHKKCNISIVLMLIVEHSPAENCAMCRVESI